MLRKITLLLLVFLVSSPIWAQNLVNGWVKPNQTYVEFKVWEDGVYRINRNDLKAINNNFITVNPKNLQVFCRGEEQFIYVHGENDFTFDNDDYIELYCRKNDGFLDTKMYFNPEEQNNPYYSQVSDTISYFITWEDSPRPKKRYNTYSSSDYASYNAINSVQVRGIYSYTDQFYWGERVSPYSSGKGWFDNKIFSQNTLVSKIIDVPNAIVGSNVNIEYSVTGVPASTVSSEIEHKIRVSYGANVMDEKVYEGYKGHVGNFHISTNDISNNSLNLVFSSFSQEEQPDNNVLAYILVNYQRNLIFSDENRFKFISPVQPSKKRLDLISIQGTNLVLYNPSSGDRTHLVPNSGSWSAVLRPFAAESEVIVSSSEAVKLVQNGKNVSFQNYASLPNNSDYLIVYPKQLEQEVMQYKNYRESTGYKVVTAEISDLYNQFAYGIEKHPMAITNFVKFIQEKYGNPTYLFLIGKGVSTADLRKNGDAFNRCFVPTMGNPPSDNLLSTDIASGSLVPDLYTGRLSAKTGDDVLTYLAKVQEYETAPIGLSRKTAIHFSGGGNYTDQVTFKQYLKSYEDVYEDTLVGGIVTTFYKSSSDPMQTSLLDSVEYLINNGVSLINFFGHGSASGFDQNIDEPQNYNNKGKYPLILANSCLSGNIHRNLPYKSISEKWVLEPQKGAIGFLASSDLGYAYHLHKYSRQLYKSMSYRKFGKSLGETVHDAIVHYSEGQTTNKYVQKTIFDNTLHADPAVPLHNFSLPDLQVEKADISFSYQPVTTQIDSFSVDIHYFNLGKSVLDTFVISVERILPNGESTLYTIVQDRCNYSRIVSVKIPTDALNSVGMNKLVVRLDNLNTIEESNEMNNDVELSFVVQSSDISPVYPSEFEVIPEVNPTLIASTGNPFEGDLTAVFEIDTTDHFNSPVFTSQEIATNGGFTEWTLPFNLMDSTVYFWRVFKKGTERRQSSSFRYIKDQRGWSQAHHYQYEKDYFKFINYEKELRNISYVDAPKGLLVKTIGSASVVRYNEIGFWLEGEGDINSCSAASAFNVVVIDSVNLEVLKSDNEDYGHRNYPKCFSRTRPDLYFQFTTSSEEQMLAMVDMLNAQTDGSHIIIYTIGNGNFENLSNDVLSAFETLNPMSSVRSLGNNTPFIMYVQKGNLSTAQEVVGSTVTDEINLSVNLKASFDYGHIYSTVIGPAREWGSFHWTYDGNIENKRTQISILGIDSSGDETILLSTLDQDSLDVYDLSNRIDAEQYPYLKLHYFTKDSISKVPAQMKSWSLLYTGVPETIIDPDLTYAFESDSLDQGDELMFAISTKNISPYDMDSLLVQYFVYDDKNQVELIKSKKLRPHPSQDVITDTVRFNTINNLGVNSLMVEFNGKNSSGLYDQLELNHYNNIAIKKFLVKKDKINPLLDVTFDGMHIMDGDIVSASPEILIKINDENRFLTMDDPDLVSVYLGREGDAEEHRIDVYDSLSNQQLFWIPSSLPDNTAEMLYTPQKLKDGLYTLRVGAIDASNNESGKNYYQITFQVINKSTITEVLNYPNPFSTATHFVFTLTGSEIPDEILLQIMTVRGVVVKQVNLSQVANIHIGKNVTNYAWDGKDEFGDQLGNGVYFYRVTVRNNGSDVEKRSTQADQFFNNGIGKMYLMR